MTEIDQSKLKIKFLKNDFPVGEFGNKNWENAAEISIDKYWSGTAAPTGRHAKAKLLWSNTALYVRFEANQDEPLVVSEKPNLKSKTLGLWDRDVCEIFVAPNITEPRKYFEFEIAPNGEWIDLGIYQLPDCRETDWDYQSGMQSAAKIESGKITMASGEMRGYLAWQPTKTPEPAFHVPQAFGEFEFTL
jgi:hypothetical protein